MDVAGASPTLSFWLCDKDSSHSWRTSVSSRTRQRTGCPQCANLEVSSANNLQYLSPALAKQFDVAANGYTPDLVVATSAKKVWWVCPLGPDHRWEASPANRYTYGHGCPYCVGKQVSISNSLQALHPGIAHQFDVEANRTGPEQIVAGSNRMVWWRCRVASDHTWRATPNNRNRKDQGCPYCAGRNPSVTNSLASLCPEIAKEFDDEANGISGKLVVAGSNTLYQWRCSKDVDHVWKAPPNKRTSKKKPTGCPDCSGQRILRKDSLATRRPNLAAEWDYELNPAHVRPEAISPGSMYRAHWICRSNPSHRWQTRVEHRTREGSGCPYPEYSLTPRSEWEIHLSFELSQFFEIDPDAQTIVGPSRKTLKVDIKIPEERLVVEFGGAYWHRGCEERDARKSR